MKNIVGSLVIELTRRCNMNCKHCLRGCAENIDSNKTLIKKVLSSFSNIVSLTLTGGEPSLVPELIEYTINTILELGIDLGGVYIVTNGKVYSKKMVEAMRKAYIYAYEPEMCGLCVSRDPFHQVINDNVYFRYKNEVFYRDDKESPDLHKYLINEGNAYYNGIGRRNLIVNTSIKPEYVFETEDTIELQDDLIYVNVNGDVLLNCDVSYENQWEYAIGNIEDSNLVDIISSHIL